MARELRTGQLKAADVTQQSLHDLICGKIQIMVASGCPDLYVDLREFATFQDAAQVTIKLTPDGDLDTSDFAVSPGPSMSKNMLRVFYKWPVMTDFLAKVMSNLKGGKTLLFSSVTWQNEPFDD